MNKKFKDKNIIITGGTDGLGLATAKNFINNGANLITCSRSNKKIISARKLLSPKLIEGQKLILIQADVSCKEDVEKLISTAVSNFSSIDIIISNAGIYGPIGKIETIDWDNWVEAININLLGSILVIKNVLPILKKQNKGKIIQISGGGATNPMPNFSSYTVSKSGIVRFVETISEEVRNYNIDINAIAPGALNTKMLDDLIKSGPANVGEDFYNKSISQKKEGGVGFSHGVALISFLASSESDGISGKLISALWDKYYDWPNHIKELKSSELYTLRRIIGRDRNQNWGDK